ncbi:MAG: hypothetical protein AAF682_00155 [Planctomycetota bacterium]
MGEEYPIEIPFAEELSPELAKPRVLGEEDVDEGGFFASVPDQPIGVPIRSILEACHEDSGPPLSVVSETEFAHLYERFELWLIPHGVSIIRRAGFAEVTSVGVEVEYQNSGQTCSVRSLIPSCEHIVHGRVAGSLGLNGEASVDPESVVGKVVQEHAGLGFGLRAEGRLELSFSASVATPLVSAVGIDSSRCEWRLKVHEQPLFGRDLRFWSVVALPKRQASLLGNLPFRTRFSFSSRIALFPRTRRSGWYDLQCRLDP